MASEGIPFAESRYPGFRMSLTSEHSEDCPFLPPSASTLLDHLTQLTISRPTAAVRNTGIICTIGKARRNWNDRGKIVILLK